MGKIIAIIGLIIFFWWAYPHVKAGEWFAATPLPPGWWGLAQAPQYDDYAKPQDGYGVYRYDFWNNPPTTGRQVVKSDFQLNK